MNSPRLDQHKERVGLLSTIFVDVVANNTKALEQPDVRSILDPQGALHGDGMNIADVLGTLSTERANLYFDLIEKQKDLADAGIERVQVLHDHFDFYSGHILGGRTVPAQSDIMQQALDVSIMFTCSESALKFAAQYSTAIDPKYLRYKLLVDRQYSALKTFQALELDSPEKLTLSGRTYTEAEKEYASDEIERTTLNVSNRNIDLSEAIENLLCNQARCMYAWTKSLDDITPNSRFYPREDVKFEADLVSLYLERIKILTDRHAKTYELASKINPAP